MDTKRFLLFGTLVVFNSCNSAPTNPLATADINGRVLLAKSESELTPPYNGVTVTIEGTDFTAISDDSGYFSFTGVPSGTYNVDYTKPGFGEIRLMSATVVGGGSAPIYWYNVNNDPIAPMLLQCSEVVTTLKSATFVDTTVQGDSTRWFIARGSVKPDLSRPQSEEGMILFFSHTSDVSAAPGHYTAYCYGNDMSDNGISEQTMY